MSLHAALWAYMKFHELTWSSMCFMSLHAVSFFVWAAHKNFEVLVILSPEFPSAFFLGLTGTIDMMIWMLYIETLDVIHRHNTNTSARGQAREGQTRHKTHIKQEESGNHHNNGTDLSLWGQQSKVNFTFKHLSSFPLYFFVQNVLTSISTHLPNLLTVSDSLYFFVFRELWHVTLTHVIRMTENMTRTRVRRNWHALL